MNRIGEAEFRYLDEVMRGEFRASAMSNMTGRFEEAFAERFGARFAISHVNGTATMHSALAAAGVGPGDEVIVPPLTMASTSLVVLHQNATPVFADIDPTTLTIDPASIEARITSRTKAIIPVSLYGLAPDFDPIMALAEQHGLTVIEDDAECYLGQYKGRTVGTIGHMASFSLQASKHITAGEGGVVLTDDEGLADRVRGFSVLGYDVVRAKQGKITKDVLQSPDYARHTGFGFKYKMPDLCAAVALGQLERLDALVAARQEAARAWDAALAGCGWLAPQAVPADRVHAYYTYAVRLSLGQVDFGWHDFRRKLMELGGDGIYAAWRLTYNEPLWGCCDHRVRAVVAEDKFELDFPGYWRTRCPEAERAQPEIMQFKTNLLDPARRQRQAEILAATIAHFEGAP